MKEGWRAVGGREKRGGEGESELYGYHLTAFVHSIFFQHNFLHSSMNIAKLRYPTKLAQSSKPHLLEST